MRGARIKAIRKYVQVAYPPNQQNQKLKQLKRAKRLTNLKASLPQSPKPFSTKIHKGENLEDFAERRRICNAKKRKK